MASNGLGATGKHPDGALGPDDTGELQMGVARDSKGNVVINFGGPVSWLAMPPIQAVQLANLLLKHAGCTAVEITMGAAEASKVGLPVPKLDDGK